ncbi:MAG: DUF3833 family protein [Gammaproteobacteria bacterium]
MSEEQGNHSPGELLIEEYFAGHTRAWGLFEDRFGNVRREFVIDSDGEWDGSHLFLTENFTYSDGERETRVWTFEKTRAGTYTGSADGVVGIATGQAEGNALRWEYDFDLPVGDRTWRVRFDDRMLLLDDEVLISKADVNRWGIRIGTVFISFHKSTSNAVREATDNVSRPNFGARRTGTGVAAAG